MKYEKPTFKANFGFEENDINAIRSMKKVLTSLRDAFDETKSTRLVDRDMDTIITADEVEDWLLVLDNMHYAQYMTD